MTLTAEQRKAKQEKYQKDLKERIVINPKNEYERCILEKDGTLSFITGDFRQGGRFLSKTYNKTSKPYWNAVADELGKIKQDSPDYYAKIKDMLVARGQTILDIIALAKTFCIMTDVDRRIFKKNATDDIKRQHNELYERIDDILNKAFLMCCCKEFNPKTEKYEPVLLTEQVQYLKTSIKDVRKLINNQLERNRNEIADRNI